MPNTLPDTETPSELFAGDGPYSYASVLADLLAELRRLDPPEYATDILYEDADPPESALDVLGVIRETLTHEVAITPTEDGIVYEYPSASDAYDSDTSTIAQQVTARIEYHPDGRVWVETRYADEPDPEYKTMYWQGWLDEYDEYEAYKMGALVAIRLLGQYTEAGLSAAQALDLGATRGIGYGDYFSWANRRDVDYEAIRKNAAKGRDDLTEAGWDGRMLDRSVHVARCGDCGRNKQMAASCDRERAGLLVDASGEEYERFPYGNEDTLTIEMMEERDVDEEQIESYKEVARRNPVEEGDRCPDCGVITGGIHHEGCDKEVCPQCKGQLLSCECEWVTKGTAVKVNPQ